MYDTRSLAPETITWALDQASNELNAYLCEGDPYVDNGKYWPAIARMNAAHCRSVAAAATEQAERNQWLRLAKSYEETI